MKSIREIMRSNPITTTPDDPLQRAIELLMEHSISGLPVVDGDGKLVGVLSEKDLLKIFYEPEADSVRSIMTPDPMSFSIEAPLVDVIDCLMANDFRRVFVHDDGKLVGLISRADLMPAIMTALLDRC